MIASRRRPRTEIHTHRGAHPDTPVGKAIYYRRTRSAFHTVARGTRTSPTASTRGACRTSPMSQTPVAQSSTGSAGAHLRFATGSTPAEVRERLQSRAAELDLLFRGHNHDTQPTRYTPSPTRSSANAARPPRAACRRSVERARHRLRRRGAGSLAAGLLMSRVCLADLARSAHTCPSPSRKSAGRRCR